MISVWELLIAFVVVAVPVIVVIKFMLRNKRENIRLRLEVGKLADELERSRKLKDMGQGEPESESR